ncbi:hypothetical protein SLW73_03975 [Glutamicibacter protophormiae]|uniref:hypothetical protein n=1 Tax=Glutamicibacter protophormiae TaxID=37930 RepID=UPI002A7FBD08|nr:hypothetical protein [Glutamicibacter protophormiae]WPR65490.1 hypothetical protein SLW72_03975 [Glutamicibacter protophormiae]WPR68988.1 hypothetical protein SLW73_03975 [Glutamicibacter protophormiae]
MPTQRELQRELLAKNPHYSAGQAKAVAKKMIWIEANGFFEKLRINGIISDPTAREAVRNLEAAERKPKMKERPKQCSAKATE